jgi:hypothetical protein
MKTVAELFDRLEAQGLTYAVLRNYENLPDLRVSELENNTDVDLVVASGELPRFRKVLISLARDMEWDALTECEHFSHSRARHHNIEIFRFYRTSPLEFLQIDVFHGYVNWGLPLMDEAELLSERCYDAQRRLTHIDPVKENIFRLAQLHGLRGSKGAREKVSRYRRKILAALARFEVEYSGSIRRYFGKAGLDAVRALKSGNAGNFTRAMHRAKASFAVRFAFRHPGRTVRFIRERIGDNHARFHSQQCGALLKVHAADGEAREALIAVMNALTKVNAFDRWTENSDPKNRFTHRERNVMEQGGLVIEWTDRLGASLVIEGDESTESIRTKIIACAVARHTVLYSAEHGRVLLEAEPVR